MATTQNRTAPVVLLTTQTAGGTSVRASWSTTALKVSSDIADVAITLKAAAESSAIFPISFPFQLLVIHPDVRHVHRLCQTHNFPTAAVTTSNNKTSQIWSRYDQGFDSTPASVNSRRLGNHMSAFSARKVLIANSGSTPRSSRYSISLKTSFCASS